MRSLTSSVSGPVWARVALAALLLSGAVAPAFGVVRPSDILGDVTVADLPGEFAAKAPDLGAAAGVLMTSDGRILWSRQADEERAMASTTKIMTAIVALENADLDDPIVISERAATIGEAAARIRAGATYPLRTLLEAMLVKSGNDASVAVAEHIGGSVEGFAEIMNEKARQLGLEHTAFVNPHGLDAPGHYTSAADLATLARYAMSNSDFRRMVALEKVVIDGTGGPQELENSNVLIGTLEGATGVKTGWTSRAGYCLVAAAERRGIELFAVVLGTTDEMERFQQAGLLLEWGFVHFGEERLAETGEVLGTLPVADYLDREIEAVVGVPAVVPVFDLAGEISRSVTLPDSVDAPVARGDRMGTLSLVQGGRLIAQVPLIAVEDIRRPSWPERVWIALVRAWRSLFGGSPEAVPAS
ncbi:MAG: D-alanyl-D-alanine carboxypeptidase family protein [Anaerosomatales bacterium]